MLGKYFLYCTGCASVESLGIKLSILHAAQGLWFCIGPKCLKHSKTTPPIMNKLYSHHLSKSKLKPFTIKLNRLQHSLPTQMYFSPAAQMPLAK